MLSVVSKKKFEIESGASPTPHEIKAANYLVGHGFKLLFLKPANRKGVRTPDVEINGDRFEIKSPVSNKPRTIVKRFKEARKQADRIVFDLRGVKGGAENTEKLLLKLAQDSQCRRLIVITKHNQTIDTVA
jgi:hypothetical protein